MSERLRCMACGLTSPVSDEDPDASVADMVDHMVARHSLRPDTAPAWIDIDTVAATP